MAIKVFFSFLYSFLLQKVGKWTYLGGGGGGLCTIFWIQKHLCFENRIRKTDEKRREGKGSPRWTAQSQSPMSWMAGTHLSVCTDLCHLSGSRNETESLKGDPWRTLLSPQWAEWPGHICLSVQRSVISLVPELKLSREIPGEHCSVPSELNDRATSVWLYRSLSSLWYTTLTGYCYWKYTLRTHQAPLHCNQKDFCCNVFQKRCVFSG